MLTALMWTATAALLVFVGWPLFRAPRQHEPPEADGVSPLERQKLEAYAAIKDAELDRRMGKLSDEDFAAITARHRQQALAAISAIEQARRSVPTRRETTRRMAFCPWCGEKLVARANFCSACGRALRESAA